MAPDDIKSDRAARLGELVAIATNNVQQQQKNQKPVLRYGACEPNNLHKKSSFEARELGQFVSGQDDKLGPRGKRLSGSSSTTSLGGRDEDADQDHDQDASKLAFIERLAKIIPGLGIMLALCASVFLGTAGMLVKLTTSVHGIQVAVFRALIQLTIYSVIISWRRIGWMPARGELVPSGLRALLGGASITFSYYALKLIPLGDATTIRFSLPIWTLIMSYFFLHESCSLPKVSAVFISVLGVVLIAKPDECVYLVHLVLNALRWESDEQFLLNAHQYEQARIDEESTILVTRHTFEYKSPFQVVASPAGGDNQTGSEGNTTSSDLASTLVLPVSAETLRQFEGCMLALASSICLSLSLIALRLCKKTPAEITIWWLSIMSVLIGSLTLLLLNEWRLPNNMHDWAFILLNGVCGAIGQWFITSALKVEQSGIIALARTCDIEIAFLYSALLLGEDIRATSIVGSVLVSLGVIIVVLPRWLSSRAAPTSGSNDEQPEHEVDRCSPPTTITSASSSSLEDGLTRQRMDKD